MRLLSRASAWHPAGRRSPKKALRVPNSDQLGSGKLVAVPLALLATWKGSEPSLRRGVAC